MAATRVLIAHKLPARKVYRSVECGGWQAAHGLQLWRCCAAIRYRRRYELERGLLDGSVAVADLPRLWNERMASYLGCTPADDAEGVLQVCPYVWVAITKRNCREMAS